MGRGRCIDHNPVQCGVGIKCMVGIMSSHADSFLSLYHEEGDLYCIPKNSDIGISPSILSLVSCPSVHPIQFSLCYKAVSFCFLLAPCDDSWYMIRCE